MKLLEALQTPRDRLELSKDLKLDWKGINRHIQVLQRLGLVQVQATYGKNVKMYILTEFGVRALELAKEPAVTIPQTTAPLPVSY